MDTEYISTDLCLTTQQGLKFLIQHGVIIQRDKDLWESYGQWGIKLTTKVPSYGRNGKPLYTVDIFCNHFNRLLEWLIAKVQSNLGKGVPYKLAWAWELVVFGQTTIEHEGKQFSLEYNFTMEPDGGTGNSGLVKSIF